MPDIQLTDRARGVGAALARKVFDTDESVTIREEDLAALLALAYALGRAHTLESVPQA